MLERALVLQDRVRGAEPGVGGKVLPGGQAGAEGGEDWLRNKKNNNEGGIKCAMGKMNVFCELIVVLGTLPVSRLHAEKQVKQKKSNSKKNGFIAIIACRSDIRTSLPSHVLCTTYTAKVLVLNSPRKFQANLPHRSLCTLVYKSSLCT